MDEKQHRKARSVSLYSEDEHIVSELVESKGLDFSSALRVIIREWNEMQQARKPLEELNNQ